MAMPYKRQYVIGVCFLCQLCLYCESKLSITTCQCDLNKKPTLKNTGKEKKNLLIMISNVQDLKQVKKDVQLIKY